MKVVDVAEPFWVGESCARMFEGLALALGGTPRRSPLPVLRVVA